MTRHVLAPIETATDHVADELAEVAAERDAFAAFADRVEACATRSPSGVTLGPKPRTVTNPPDHAARLRRAYRETVMAVDHYDAVYGEPLAVNVATELGTDIATALCAGVPVTPAFKRTLHDAAVDARTERDRFETILRRERESLADARAALDDVVSDLSRHRTLFLDAPNATDGGAPPTPLVELERRCERVSADRQAVIQRQLTLRRIDGTLFDYLYGDRSWTYPVLSVVATLLDDLSVLSGRSSAADG